MKKKFILFILLMASVVYEASAFKIIISGGGRRQKFDYVVVTDDLVKCIGNGSIKCPVSFEDDQSLVPKTYNNLDLLIDYVRSQVDGGRKIGSSVYNSWPISWRYNSDSGNIEINVDEVQVENPTQDAGN